MVITDEVRTSLIENGFDCSWNLTTEVVSARADSRPELHGLVEEVAAFVSKVLAPEWLPDSKDHFVPVRGGSGEPDRILYRHAPTISRGAWEIVCNEFAIALNVDIQEPKPVATSMQAAESFRKNSGFMIRSVNLAGRQLHVTKVGAYWIVFQVFPGSTPGDEKQVRLYPWTWSESVRMAIDSQGSWLSVSVRRLPDRVDSMPKGGSGRAGGSWFDSYIAALSAPR